MENDSMSSHGGDPAVLLQPGRWERGGVSLDWPVGFAKLNGV